MPTAIPNGGGGDDPTTQEAAAYNAAFDKPSGDRTPQEQEAVEVFEEKVRRIGGAKVDSGGAGGRKAQVAIEVGRDVARLEANRKQAIDQWAREAASGGPSARTAQIEMHGADTAFFVEVLFQLKEIRERLNDSPY